MAQREDASSSATPVLSQALLDMYRVEHKDDPDLSENEQIEIGEQSNNILESLAFQTAFRGMTNQIIEQLVMSKPNEKELREDMYNRMQVLQDITFQLSVQVEAARESYVQLEAARRENH